MHVSFTRSVEKEGKKTTTSVSSSDVASATYTRTNEDEQFSVIAAEEIEEVID